MLLVWGRQNINLFKDKILESSAEVLLVKVAGLQVTQQVLTFPTISKAL